LRSGVARSSTCVIRNEVGIALQSRRMELKRLITQFTYRIEPKPEGGFIARATDATLPPLEAATREELQRKIQANIAAGLAEEFPGLKLPLDNQELKFAFHIEGKPGGGFAIHSGDPNVQSIEAATHEEVENRVAEKLLGFLGKHLAPELSQALAAPGNSGDIKVFVNRKVGFTLKTGSKTVSLGTARAIPASSNQPNNFKIEGANPGNETTYLGETGQTISNAPITPETSSSWQIFAFLLAIVVTSALMYFFFVHPR
jgi:hypothetical protein